MRGKRSRRSIAPPVLPLCALAIACSGSDGNWSGTVETLPNGAIRVSNSAQGVWREGEGWSLVPELVIGTMDGPPATVFASISGVEVDDAGRIYVLDRQANELRIFDSSGTHIRTVGRQGEGPGEYSNANGLRWLSTDSLVVIDQRGNRYSILTGDGDYVRSVRRNLGFYGWIFDGAVTGDVLRETSWVYSDAEGRDAKPVLLSTSLRDAVSPNEAVEVVDVADAAVRRAVVDTTFLPYPAASGSNTESFSVRTERGGMVMGVPFAPELVHYIDDNGELWHGRGNEFRLTHTTLPGDTIREVLLDIEPAAVLQQELDEWRSSEFVDRFIDMGGNLDMSRIPKTKPYFDGLLVDPDGHVWVFMPTAPLHTAIAVFDPEGRYLGRFDLDDVERYVYTPPVVRNERLYMVGTDEFDVPRVHVLRIERGKGQ